MKLSELLIGAKLPVKVTKYSTKKTNGCMRSLRLE